MIYRDIQRLINYAIENGLIKSEDIYVIRNQLMEALLSGKDLNDDPLTVSHAEWAKEIAHNNPDISKENVSDIICKEIGKVFEQVLLDAGVFKRNATGRQAFQRFVYTLTDGGRI